MIKRLFDIIAALLGLAVFSPLILGVAIAIYRYDKGWPLYSPPRAGKNSAVFRMHKFRSMVIGADRNRVDTTAKGDARITPIGHWLRRYKIDELPQLWNILCGQMSFVGPRPQIDREVALYTHVEQGLLTVRPGITDFSSIIFADLAEIVAGAPDANIAYNQLVRPWKSRLGLFYIEHQALWVDIALILLTAIAAIDPTRARSGVVTLLVRLNAPRELIDVCKRDQPLTPTAPPGSDKVVESR